MKNPYKNLPVHRAVGRNEVIKSGDTVFNPYFAPDGEPAEALIGGTTGDPALHSKDWRAKRPIKWRKLRVGDRIRSTDYLWSTVDARFIPAWGPSRSVTTAANVYRFYDVKQ